jgi:hypothetical protein
VIAVAMVKRPRYRPGTGRCSVCRCNDTFDRLAFKNQLVPSRALVCEACRAVLVRLKLYGHG